jgi:hypothetical protein
VLFTNHPSIRARHKQSTRATYKEGILTNVELEQADEDRRSSEDIEAEIINLFVQLSPSAQTALLERLDDEYHFHEEEDDEDETGIYFGDYTS